MTYLYPIGIISYQIERRCEIEFKRTSDKKRIIAGAISGTNWIHEIIDFSMGTTEEVTSYGGSTKIGKGARLFHRNNLFGISKPYPALGGEDAEPEGETKGARAAITTDGFIASGVRAVKEGAEALEALKARVLAGELTQSVLATIGKEAAEAAIAFSVVAEAAQQMIGMLG